MRFLWAFTRVEKKQTCADKQTSDPPVMCFTLSLHQFYTSFAILEQICEIHTESPPLLHTVYSISQTTRMCLY